MAALQPKAQHLTPRLQPIFAGSANADRLRTEELERLSRSPAATDRAAWDRDDFDADAAVLDPAAGWAPAAAATPRQHTKPRSSSMSFQLAGTQQRRDAIELLARPIKPIPGKQAQYSCSQLPEKS